jgi:hypothetical protein
MSERTQAILILCSIALLILGYVAMGHVDLHPTSQGLS